MVYCLEEPSRTFGKYLPVPGYSSAQCVSTAVSLKAPLVRFRKGEEQCPIEMDILTVSAIMQSISDDKLTIALTEQGGVSFIYGSQSVEDEADMVHRVKQYKKDSVTSDSSPPPTIVLADMPELENETGHSAVATMNDGTTHGKLFGVVASRDHRLSRMLTDLSVKEFMTPFERLITVPASTNFHDCNDIIWDNKINSPPFVGDEDRLQYTVFRKDHDSHEENVSELLNGNKSYVVGTGVSTHDYEACVPALVEADVDVLCIDPSEGYFEWREKIISWIRVNYGDRVRVGTGNVVDCEGFLFLAKVGADFVKIGTGGDFICITRKAKGIGRGQVTVVIEAAKARDDYFKQTGVYVPVCSDGGIVHGCHITLTLAIDTGFVMLGCYFAHFDENPATKLRINGNYVKEYWGEGSSRARNWQCHDLGGTQKLSFEKDVDSYVLYAGTFAEGMQTILYKVCSTMCNYGTLSIEELQKKARLTVVPLASIVEDGSHGVILRNNNRTN